MKIRAIAAGYAIIALSGIIYSVLSFLFFQMLSSSLDEGDSLTKYSVLHYATRAFVFISTVFAGYITARMARKKELLHGVILGIFSSLISNVVSYLSIASISRMEQKIFDLNILFGFIFSVGACILGAFIRKRINDKNGDESENQLEQNIENLGNNSTFD